MKLSVLPLSMRPPASNPCMSILHIALDSADGPVTDAIVGRFAQADVETVDNGSDRHTFAKCPFLRHLLHVTSRAGHFERGCLALPQKKHLLLAAADPKVRFGESMPTTDLCSQALALNDGTGGAMYSSEFCCAKSNDLA